MAGIGALLELLGGFQQGRHTEQAREKDVQSSDDAGNAIPLLIQALQQSQPVPTPQMNMTPTSSIGGGRQPPQGPPNMQGNFTPGMGWNPTPAPQPRQAPPGGGGMPQRPPMPQQPSQGQQGQQNPMQALGINPQDPRPTLKQMVLALQKADPDLKGGALLEAVSKLAPIMDSGSKQKIELLKIQLEGKRAQEHEHHDERMEDIAQQNVGMRGRGLDDREEGMAEKSANTQDKSYQKQLDKFDAKIKDFEQQKTKLTASMTASDPESAKRRIELTKMIEEAKSEKAKFEKQKKQEEPEEDSASSQYTQENLEHTAKVNGISVEEVKKRLGIE